MPLLLVLEVVVRPADVAGEGEGVAPEGPEAGVADDQYVCFSQRMAAATLPLSQTFPVFLLVFFAVPSVHLCFTHVAVNVINLGTASCKLTLLASHWVIGSTLHSFDAHHLKPRPNEVHRGNLNN